MGTLDVTVKISVGYMEVMVWEKLMKKEKW